MKNTTYSSGPSAGQSGRGVGFIEGLILIIAICAILFMLFVGGDSTRNNSTPDLPAEPGVNF